MTVAQQDLVTTNLGLVRQIAARAARSLPACVEMDEIIAAGNLGLVEAASKFDWQKHANFAVWARRFIRGRIIDAFRGPRWPRRYQEMPVAWLGIEDRETGGNMGELIPELLIDRASPLDAVIEKETCVVVAIDAYRARKSVDGVEGEVIDQHIVGLSISEISESMKISRGMAHRHLKIAKHRMREALGRKQRAELARIARYKRLAPLREEIRMALEREKEAA